VLCGHSRYSLYAWLMSSFAMYSVYSPPSPSPRIGLSFIEVAMFQVSTSRQ